ncbi:hypothetical protein ACHAAC_16760 [Aeromicrobium sp. CF4.19]|uniref:hypothetical protein n=1 Tax=Aeromicrobium sp. CF4.19 TaxID=3373082 RepID=UPI003EE51F07
MTSKTSKTKTDPMQAKADDLAAQLTAARAVLDQREAEHTAAEQHAADVLDTFETGDDETYTADDLGSAEAAERAAAALLKAAQTAVDRLQRHQISTDTKAAHALVPVVAEALKGRVPVEVRLGAAPRAAAGESLPLLVLTQAKPTTDQGGLYSADEVVVSYVRDDLHSPLSGERLERYTDRAGFQVAAMSTHAGTGADAVVDSVRLKVRKVWDATPLLVDEPTASAAEAWAASLLRR